MKSKSAEDLIAFKKARAQARRTFRECKRNSFRNYVSKINNRTPMSKIWKMIKKLKGSETNTSVKHLDRADGSTAETEFDISNTLADTLSKNSSSKNYSPAFRTEKQKSERNPVNFSSANEEDYNLPFTMEELNLKLADLSNTASGPEEIRNEILKHLPNEILK